MLLRTKFDVTLSDLLRRAGRGDHGALRQLHLLVAASLLRHAIRIVKERELAEDVLQESLIAIWRDADKFDDSLAAPMTWMAGIVRNKAYDMYRKIKVRSNVCCPGDDGGAALAMCDPRASAYEVMEQRQSVDQIVRCMAGLVHLHREAIELTYLHDLSHVEVAQAMAQPVGTVKTWIRRGVIDIRRQIRRAALMSGAAAQE